MSDELLLSKWDGEETPFWDDVPDHHATTIKKKMKRKLHVAWENWFHDDGGADLDAGRPDDYEEGDLGGYDSDGNLGGGGPGLNLVGRAPRSSTSSTAEGYSTPPVSVAGSKASSSSSGTTVAAKAMAAKALKQWRKKSAAKKAQVPAAAVAAVAAAAPRAEPRPEQVAEWRSRARPPPPREHSPLRSLKPLLGLKTQAMQSPPTSAAAPSAAKAVNAKSSRAVSTPTPSSHVAEEEAAAALSAAMERRSARKSSTFPTPLREAVGKSIASAIAFGIAQLLPQASAARLPAPQSPPEVYESVEAYNAQKAPRSSKKSPAPAPAAAAAAQAAAAAAPPSTAKATSLKNMKMQGLLKEAKKRGLSQQSIAEITAPPYQGASHFTPQKTAQLKAYLLAH
jgi:hypothetical protein